MGYVQNILTSILPSTENGELVGHVIDESTPIANLIEELVEEVEGLSKDINQPRPARVELKSKNKEWTDRASKSRGRALFYPYVGTGAGRGPYVELEDGSVKLDLINGIGVHIMGHSHPNVIRASLKGALSDILMQGNLQLNRDHLRLTEKLIELASKGSRLKYAWISTCGSVANENALKMARQKNSPARHVLAMENAFAGRTTMMAELTDNPAYKEGLPSYNEILRLPYYEKSEGARSIELATQKLKQHIDQHKGDISCFVFEPMLGEGGYKVAPREFWISMLEVCRQNKIIVWADEVQTFLRTGEAFAFQTMGFGEYVDLVTIAKTAQVAATLYTEELNPKPGLVAGTFAASTPSLHAGYEILRMMSEDGYFGKGGRIDQIHKKFVGMLNELCAGELKDQLRDPEGMGLMVAATPLDGTKDTVNKLLQKLFENGLMAFPCGKSPVRLRFLLPAVLEDKDIEHARNIIKKSILEMVNSGK